MFNYNMKYVYINTIKIDGSGTVFIDFFDDAIQIIRSQLVVQSSQNFSQYSGCDVTVSC